MTPCLTGSSQMFQQQQPTAQTDPLLMESHRVAIFQQNSTGHGVPTTPNHYPQGILRSSGGHGGTATTVANNIGGSNHVGKKPEFRDMNHGNVAMNQLNISQMNIPSLRESEMTTFTGGSLKRPRGGEMGPHSNSVGSTGAHHHVATLPRIGSIGGLNGSNMRLAEPPSQFAQQQYSLHNQMPPSHGQQGCQQTGIQEIRV